MLAIDREIKDAIESAERKNLILAFDDGTVVDNDDIALESMELEQSISEEEVLRFGGINSACFKVKIKGTTKEYKNLWFNASLNVGDYSLPLGRFLVNSDVATSDRQYRDVVAYDSLYCAMNKDVSDWYNGLTFPISIYNIRNSLFEYIGIGQVETKLINDDYMVDKTLDGNGISCHRVLSAICELNAVFGVINAYGQFKYVQINNLVDSGLFPSETLYPSEDLYTQDVYDDCLSKADYKLGSLTYEEFSTQNITKVVIREEVNDVGVSVGEDGNTYAIEDNFLVYGDTIENLTVVAQNIFDYAKHLTYTPASLKCNGKPWREVGDMIQVYSNDRVFHMPIMNRVLKGIQAIVDTYSAQGRKTYEEQQEVGYKADLRQLKSRTNVLERTIDETRSEISRVETNLQKQIDNNIETYSDNYVPTLLNAPASGWTTDEEKDKHLGDLYHVNSEGGDYAGFYYRFEKTSSGYQWTLLKDTEITKALKEAEEANQKAQEVADDLYANYSTTVQMNSAIKQSADEINLSVSKTLAGYSTTEQMNAAIKLSADGINTEVSKKVGSDEIISKINQSPESVTINATKIDLIGAVTFSSLDSATQSIINTAKNNASSALSTANTANTNASNAVSTASTAKSTADGIASNIYTSGTTTIDGGKITTGSIKANKIESKSLTSEQINVNELFSRTITLGGKDDVNGCLTVLNQYGHENVVINNKGLKALYSSIDIKSEGTNGVDFYWGEDATSSIGYIQLDYNTKKLNVQGTYGVNILTGSRITMNAPLEVNGVVTASSIRTSSGADLDELNSNLPIKNDWYTLLQPTPVTTTQTTQTIVTGRSITDYRLIMLNVIIGNEIVGQMIIPTSIFSSNSYVVDVPFEWGGKVYWVAFYYISNTQIAMKTNYTSSIKAYVWGWYKI